MSGERLRSAGSVAGASLLTKQGRLERTLEEYRTDLQVPKPDLPREIRSLVETVRARLFDPELSVASLRATCGLSNNNVSSRFKFSLGMGIREYIEALRLDGACRLLEEHRAVEIFLVGMAVGYRYPETFCRAFLRRYGCSPSEWRSLGRAAEPAPRRRNVKTR